jgi:hypothetical protein
MGTIDRVRYRDAEFAVVVVRSEAGMVTVSGRMGAACPGMPLDAEIESRTGGGDRHYGESAKLVSHRDPGRQWLESSGVYAWLRSGAAGCASVADKLALAFGSHLAKTVVESPELCAEVLSRSLYRDDTDSVVGALRRFSMAAVAAADLGGRGVDWLAGRLTLRSAGRVTLSA